MKPEQCRVCGRTPEQLREIDVEPTLSTHQGIAKCRKCVNEYQRETPDPEHSAPTQHSWKNQATA